MKKWFSRGRRVQPSSSPSSSSSSSSSSKNNNSSSSFIKRLRSTDSAPEGFLPMYLVRLSTLQQRYGGRKYPKIDSFETLKAEGEIFEWKDVPKDSMKIYVSHEWLSNDHADPKGVHTQHLLGIMLRLGKGEFEVSMDPFHTIIYGNSHTTTKGDWERNLNPDSTYIWFDWFCVPSSHREDALRSVHGYIRRANFVLTLVPGAKHEDRIDPITNRNANLCFRTYRRRAFCVLDLFCSFLTTREGETTQPVLLVRGGTGNPMWISPLEVQKLAVGTSIFSCCEHNHKVIKTCRRSVARVMLMNLVDSRSQSLFAEKKFAEARLMMSFSKWWTRGLFDDSHVSSVLFSHRGIKAMKRKLCWDDKVEPRWVDREGVPLLFYSVLCNTENTVKEILQDIDDKSFKKRLPKSGFPSLGLTGGCTPLACAMTVADVKIVVMLLEHGAEPFETDDTGNDPFAFACMFGRLDNAKFWLKRFPDWDIGRRNSIVGGFAASHCVYMGPNRLDLIRFLLKQKNATPFSMCTFTGSNLVSCLCSSEDGDINALRYILNSIEDKELPRIVNNRSRGGNLKWRNIYRVAKLLTRLGLASSGLIKSLAREAGFTPLHYAVMKGDVDAVNILLQYNADLNVKNDLNYDVLEYCDAFPEIAALIRRARAQTKHSRSVRTITRRVSTACEMLYDMWLLSLEQLQALYGGERPTYQNVDVFQKFKAQNELTNWNDLPYDSNIIFISHEWCGWKHADPHGVQIRCFLHTLQKLETGGIQQVRANEQIVWKDTLRTTFVWMDWFSIPQRGIDETSQTDIELSLRTIPAYVERADFVTIVAPACKHKDRYDRSTNKNAELSYRSFRTRGWCVLEMFASYFSRDKTHPILLISDIKENEGPVWVSATEVSKLAVGRCSFTCCERNHIFEDKKVVKCDRFIIQSILDTLIKKKINSLLISAHCVARFFIAMKSWWLRGLVSGRQVKGTIEKLKAHLLWDDVMDGTSWKCRDNISILLFAVLRNELSTVQEIIRTFPESVQWKLRKKGVPEVGLPGNVDCLWVSMCYGSPDIVTTLLEAGSHINTVDVYGNDTLMSATSFGRVEHVKLWLERFSNWDLKKKNKTYGANVLSIAASDIQNSKDQLEIMQLFVNHGLSLRDSVTDAGATVLLELCCNNDASANACRWILEHEPEMWNRKRSPQTLRWKLKYTIARFLCAIGLGNPKHQALAEIWERRKTPLEEATRRGNMEVVRVLTSESSD